MCLIYRNYLLLQVIALLAASVGPGKQIVQPHERVTSLCVLDPSPSLSTKYLVGGEFGNVYTVSNTGKLLATSTCHEMHAVTTIVTAGVRTVVTASLDSTIRIWRVEDDSLKVSFSLVFMIAGQIEYGCHMGLISSL